jgi:Type I phosphodiesterase / nucleotide pyrophosphatase
LLDPSIEEALLSRRFQEELILPSYDTFCISNIPGTISSLFGIRTKRVLPREPIASHVDTDGIRRAILLVVDGLGYDIWSRHARYNGFFQEMTEKGLVFPITTVFPSTTAAALTTLATGLTPQEHGLPEWHVYIKNLDMIIATLPFSPMGERGQDRLIGTASPTMLFSGIPLLHTLRTAGVETKALLSSHIAASAYTRIAMRGSEIIPYASLSDMAVKLARTAEDSKEPAFVYAYWDGIDIIGHLYGPDSQEFEAETSTFSGVLKREFLEGLDRDSTYRTLLIVTADHGQLCVSPGQTIYLNKLKNLKRNFMSGDKGRPILPTWSPRDVALYIDEGKLDHIYDYLSKTLGDAAFVIKTRDAIEGGFFGVGVPTRRFLERAGNLLVLPRENKTVWYEFIKGKKFELLGMHGGLTKTELLVPFAISNLGRLS